MVGLVFDGRSLGEQRGGIYDCMNMYFTGPQVVQMLSDKTPSLPAIINSLGVQV